ncbi:hypothetical protein DL98DRAFT_605793, partial [Cadophora sp. DSE1049]
TNYSIKQWRRALYTPRVIGATSPDSIKGPRPKHDVIVRYNNIRGVCHEARVEALKCQQSLMDEKGWKVFDNPCGFTIKEMIDYLWAHGDESESCYAFISNIAHFVCEGPIGSDLIFDNLALGLEDWLEFADDFHYESITFNFSRIADICTEHIFIVVGDLSALSCPDVQLVAPRNDPVISLPTKYLGMVKKKNLELSKPSTNEQLLTWEGLDAWHMECLRDFQAKRVAFRKKMIADGHAADEADLNKMDFGFVGDCSGWLIETIRFVEATSQQEQKKRLQMS